MRNRSKALFIISSLVIGLQTAASLAATPVLKRSVVVQSDLVRIGDLIDNAGAAANIAIFRAPDLGVTGAVPTAKVLDAVRPYQVFGVETAGISEVEVTRASRTLEGKDFESLIARAYAGQYGLGEASKLTVNLDRQARPLYLDLNASTDLNVARSSFDPRSGRFDIAFDLPGGTPGRPQLRFTGTLFEAADALVTTRSIERGQVIRTSDVRLERRPKSEIPSENAVTLDQVVGFAARQPLRPGQNLRRTDVIKANMVQRNDTVTLVYEVPGIILTTRGTALESGAEGDVVSVVNIQTKRTVQAAVAGPGRVTVAATPLASRPVAALSNSPAE
jgi:flagella basal body P-ring formation protein FlgA